MKIESYQNRSNNTFTGFRFDNASKGRFVRVLREINDPVFTDKCRSVINSQKKNPIPIDIRNMEHFFGQEVDDGFLAYVNGKFSHDDSAIDSIGLMNIRCMIDGEYSLLRFLKKAAKEADNVYHKYMHRAIENGRNETRLNERVIRSIDELA